MAHILSDFKAFLDQSPTAWHAVEQLGNRLAVCDFSPLTENEKWKLEPGKKYFVSRGGALCAFVLPNAKPERAVVLASHTDSPALKLKPQPSFQKENMSLFGVEVYGSPLLSSWLNRDLALAGRVVVTNGNHQVEERLVFLDDVALFIPQLAVHLDREVNDKGLVLNKQEHLCPIVGLTEEGSDPLHSLERLLRRHLSFHSLVSFELFLVPLESSRFVGSNNEMIASYRIDNLASVHACITAMGYVKHPTDHALQMAIFWDNEEIGSNTREGAASPFLSDVLQHIGHALKMDVEEMLMLKNNAFCVSVDMAHALNPNYPKKHDPHHQPLLGKGIVLKYNANQKYASNALSAATIVQACKALNLAHQSFVCRSDMPCGSTVGPIVAQGTGINTVDIGCPQLSMHSIREVMACQDYMDLCRLLTFLLEEV
ncbi:MAG: M18 family aminopeptidase [Parachlamydiales bacterium]|nr:M18 family aminopeptidase [Verrucomicrobiota bacterium]MBX3719117.1 M18 family aminopeptidase [Candidatus Acheromyda pituitae]